MNKSAVLDTEVVTLDGALRDLEDCCSRLGLSMHSQIDLSRLRIEIVEVESIADTSSVRFAIERTGEWLRVTLLDALRAI